MSWEDPIEYYKKVESYQILCIAFRKKSCRIFYWSFFLIYLKIRG